MGIEDSLGYLFGFALAMLAVIGGVFAGLWIERSTKL